MFSVDIAATECVDAGNFFLSAFCDTKFVVFVTGVSERECFCLFLNSVGRMLPGPQCVHSMQPAMNGFTAGENMSSE